MKKTSYISAVGFCIMLCVMLLGGCRKAPINGKLDGQWQIMNIEYLADGSDITPELRYYIDISLHVVQLRSVPAVVSSNTGNLKYDKDASTITIDFPYITTESQLEQLQRWGIFSNPVTLNIVKLDGKQLVLKSDESVISCRRY